MAKLQITLTRPSTEVSWYQPSQEEFDYIDVTYPSLTRVIPDVDVPNVLELTREYDGEITECNALYADFMNPSSILHARFAYFAANNITYNYVVIE